MPILDRIQAAGRDAWLSFVKRVNAAAGSLMAALTGALATYPDETKAFIHHLPIWVAFPAAVVFCLFVNHALKRAKNAS